MNCLDVVELTPEERLLRAIFGEKARDVKDTSLTLPHGKRGRIVGVKVFSREQGDKLESLVDDQLWPFPKYREMLFLI